MTGAGRLRILVADDHTVTRETLCARLSAEPDFQVVGQASDGYEAVYLARTTAPHLVLLDLSMPRLSGAQAAQALASTAPEARVVVLSGYAEPVDARGLAALGVAGYVSKTASFGELVAVLRAVHRGERRLAIDPSTEADDPPGPPTPRELEVLQLVAAGLRNRDIADRLAIRLKTVEFHLGNLRSKLDAGSRVELVQRARRLGWVV